MQEYYCLKLTQINTGVEKNDQHSNIDYNFDLQGPYLQHFIFFVTYDSA